MPGVTLEFLTDTDTHLMIVKGIRGRIPNTVNRYSVANNKYVSNYDPSNPSKYIMYLANNFYGWAMLKHFPLGILSGLIM